MGRREERRRARQGEAVVHALALYREGGYSGLTMATLAERMGASVGGLYRYFPSKADLVVALQHEALSRFMVHMIDALEHVNAPWERVTTVAQSWASFRSAAPVEFKLLNDAVAESERQLDDDRAKDVDAQVSEVLEVLANELRDAANKGAIKPGPSLTRAYMLWASLHGLEQLRKRDSRQPEELKVDALTAALLSDLRRAWS